MNCPNCDAHIELPKDKKGKSIIIQCNECGYYEDNHIHVKSNIMSIEDLIVSNKLKDNKDNFKLSS